MENRNKQTKSITTRQSKAANSPFFNIHSQAVVQKVDDPFFNPHPQNAFFTKSFQPSNRPTIQTKTNNNPSIATPSVKSENKTGLPDNLKSGIENLSGMDVSDIKVHFNSSKPKQINALAYAQGSDIHLAAGQEKHLSHEAWHVVQQKQGRVQPTVQMKDGLGINEDAGLEREADLMGEKAGQSTLQRKGKDTNSTFNNSSSNDSSQIVQMKLEKLTTAELLKAAGEAYKAHINDLLNALNNYEKVPEIESEKEALAFDIVLNQYDKAKDAIGNILDNKADEKLGILLDWLYSFYTELNKEREKVVLRLPIVNEYQALLDKFPNHGHFSVHARVKELHDNEPQVLEKHEGVNEVKYENVNGVPFNENGPMVEDVKQGLLGDCWLLAPLISLVDSATGKDKIFNIIQPNKKGAEVYVVTLFENIDGKLEPISITVPSRFPMYKSKKDNKSLFAYASLETEAGKLPLWPVIIEKAFAMLLGNDYGELSGSPTGSTLAFEAILGTKEKDDAPLLGEIINPKKVTALVKAGKRVVVSSKTHYYSVINVTDEGINLRNPHGKNEVKTWAELKDFTYQYATL